MTHEILAWLRERVAPLMINTQRVAEIGAYNVNGSARDALQTPSMEWIGLDREPGPCVDVVCQADAWLSQHRASFDCVIACESYEHDPNFWVTNAAARYALKVGGLYIVTTPTLAFPYHSYGGDFFRFTEDAYRQVFFAGWLPAEIITLGQYPHQCVAGVARKPDFLPGSQPLCVDQSPSRTT